MKKRDLKPGPTSAHDAGEAAGAECQPYDPIAQFKRDAQVLAALQAENTNALGFALQTLQSDGALPATLALFTVDEEGVSNARVFLNLQALFDELGDTGKEIGGGILNRWASFPLDEETGLCADFGIYMCEAWMGKAQPLGEGDAEAYVPPSQMPENERDEVVIIQGLHPAGPQIALYHMERDAQGVVQALRPHEIQPDATVSGRMVADPQRPTARNRMN